MIELLGYCAGFLTTVSFVPQAVRIWRTRSARDVSLPTFVMLCCGMLLWFVYGLLVRSVPMVLANGVTLLLGLCIIIMKVRFRPAP